MYYEPGDDPTDKSVHGLPHNPFKAIVAPRPIGWISSLDAQGRPNLAPYSFFNGVSDAPPAVMFAMNGGKPDRPDAKDSVANIVETGEFVVNIVTEELKDVMNATSAILDAGVDEFEHAGIEKAACRVVKAPRVAASPAALECKLIQTVELPAREGGRNVAVFGQVVGVHIDDAALSDGLFDAARLRLLTRLGYMDYAVLTETFTLKRPK